MGAWNKWRDVQRLTRRTRRGNGTGNYKLKRVANRRRLRAWQWKHQSASSCFELSAGASLSDGQRGGKEVFLAAAVIQVSYLLLFLAPCLRRQPMKTRRTEAPARGPFTCWRNLMTKVGPTGCEFQSSSSSSSSQHFFPNQLLISLLPQSHLRCFNYVAVSDRSF